VTYPVAVPLYRLDDTEGLVAPTLIAAFDGWVDAGSAATAAAGRIADGGRVVATFDADRLFDYRARRPTLEIVDGRPATLSWPELVIRRTRIGDRDILVLSGPEPDFRWHEFADDAVEIATRLGVADWVSLGAIPAAVPHTRPVPVLGTASRSGLLRAGVEPGPEGVLRVPSAALSVVDMAVTAAGIPAVGYFAQVPHYVSGAYPGAAIELLRIVGLHLGAEIAPGPLAEEAWQLRTRLDAATAIDEATRSHVERLETMVDEARRPSGDDLISEIERFLRDRGGEGKHRPN
jgi:hypothetical protein